MQIIDSEQDMRKSAKRCKAIKQKGGQNRTKKLLLVYHQMHCRKMILDEEDKNKNKQCSLYMHHTIVI